MCTFHTLQRTAFDHEFSITIICERLLVFFISHVVWVSSYILPCKPAGFARSHHHMISQQSASFEEIPEATDAI